MRKSRWKGSVYKLVWIDYLIYLILYFAISVIYRFGLTQDQMRCFFLYLTLQDIREIYKKLQKYPTEVDA